MYLPLPPTKRVKRVQGGGVAKSLAFRELTKRALKHTREGAARQEGIKRRRMDPDMSSFDSNPDEDNNLDVSTTSLSNYLSKERDICITDSTYKSWLERKKMIKETPRGLLKAPATLLLEDVGYKSQNDAMEMEEHDAANRLEITELESVPYQGPRS